MKKILFSGILIISVLSSFNIKGQETDTEIYVDLINESDYPIKVAIAWFDETNSDWVANGWYALDAYETKRLNWGKYKYTLYAYAYSYDLVWEGDEKYFCVTETADFKIYSTENCTADKVGFWSAYNNGDNVYSFTFLPSDEDEEYLDDLDDLY
jgi:uncharacterized membrane protein